MITVSPTAIVSIAAPVSVDEGAGIATVTVSVDNAVLGGFMVDASAASTATDTAIAGQDYTAVNSRTLTFTGKPSARSQTFTVAITNDAVPEDDETLTVSLDNLEPPLANIDISASATITILANDAIAELA